VPLVQSNFLTLARRRLQQKGDLFFIVVIGSQGLGEATKPEAQPEMAKADKRVKRGAQVAKGASAKAKTNQKATATKSAPKGKTFVGSIQSTKWSGGETGS
jgi:hypothetical protein